MSSGVDLQERQDRAARALYKAAGIDLDLSYKASPQKFEDDSSNVSGTMKTPTGASVPVMKMSVEEELRQVRMATGMEIRFRQLEEAFSWAGPNKMRWRAITLVFGETVGTSKAQAAARMGVSKRALEIACKELETRNSTILAELTGAVSAVHRAHRLDRPGHFVENGGQS